MSLQPTNFADFIAIVEGFQAAKLVYASASLVMVYDFVLCIDREVEFFWMTDANLVTKVLYYLNRFCPLLSFGFRGATLFDFKMSDNLCMLWVRFDFAWSILALYLAEVVLVVRVWNLYSGQRKTQWVILIISVLGLLAALMLIIEKLTHITVLKNVPQSFHRITGGCLPGIPGEFFSVFVPIFISETFLFILTLYRLRASLARAGSSHPLIRCLIVDGTAFYFAVLSTVAFSLAGSTLKIAPQFSIGALLSNSIVTGCSVAACRLILSIRSLAARLKYDPDAVFNHLELARIYGNGLGKIKVGDEYGSKIIIEVNAGDMELEELRRPIGKERERADSYCATEESAGYTEEVTLGPWRSQLHRR